jgi:hypothetical protein
VNRNAVIEARWAAIRDKILANAAFLETQGALNAKAARGRTVYRIRFRVPDRGRMTQKNIYIGDEPRLVARTQELLREIRDARAWPRQVATYAHLVAGLVAALKRQGLTT